MKNNIGIVIMVIGLVALLNGEAEARGFGGFHGGGHVGGIGGVRPGGFSGGYRPGGFSGGYRPGGFNSGYRPGGFNSGYRPNNVRSGYRPNNLAGGYRPNNFNRSDLGGNRGDGVGGLGRAGERTPNRSQLGNYLGMPSDAGLHHIGNAGSLNGFDANRRAGVGPRGGRGVGGRVEGPRGGSAGRGVGVGPRGNVYGGRYGTGPRGNTIAQGFRAGPNGFFKATGANLHNYGSAIRSSFRGYNYFRPDWYGANRGAWYTNNWAVGSAWTWANWDSVNDWLGYGYGSPTYYNYGTNVYYNDGDMYVNNENVGSEQQYYESAAATAEAGANAETSDDEKWLPLGVFSASPGKETAAVMIFQLAVNKKGVIRGNYSNTKSGSTEKVQGSVDKKTQTANWVLEGNKQMVFQTGLYNLTKDQAPCLVLQGKDQTQQWILVRLKQPKGNGDQKTD
jgi:hypothetical protein